MNPPLFFSFLSFSQMPLKTAQFVTCLKAIAYKSRNQKTYLVHKSCVIHERSSDLSHNNLSALEDPRPHLLSVSSSSNNNNNSNNSSSLVLRLMLAGNPLQCHCSLAWLQQLLNPRQEEEEEEEGALIIQEQHNNTTTTVNDS